MRGFFKRITGWGRKRPTPVSTEGRFIVSFELDHIGQFYVFDKVLDEEFEFTSNQMWTMLRVVTQMVSLDYRPTIATIRKGLEDALREQSEQSTMLSKEITTDLRLMMAQCDNIEEAASKREEAIR